MIRAPVAIVRGSTKVFINDMSFAEQVFASLDHHHHGPSGTSIATLARAADALQSRMAALTGRNMKSIRDVLFACRYSLTPKLRKRLQDFNTTYAFLRHTTPSEVDELMDLVIDAASQSPSSATNASGSSLAPSTDDCGLDHGLFRPEVFDIATGCTGESVLAPEEDIATDDTSESALAPTDADKDSLDARGILANHNIQTANRDVTLDMLFDRNYIDERAFLCSTLALLVGCDQDAGGIEFGKIYVDDQASDSYLEDLVNFRSNVVCLLDRLRWAASIAEGEFDMGVLAPSPSELRRFECEFDEMECDLFDTCSDSLPASLRVGLLARCLRSLRSPAPVSRPGIASRISLSA